MAGQPLPAALTEPREPPVLVAMRPLPARKPWLEIAVWAAVAVAAWLTHRTGLGWANAFGLFLAGSMILWLWRGVLTESCVCLLLSALVGTLYFASTFGDTRQYDMVGHLQFARSILSGMGVPWLSAGWETYHPPLYYAVGAAWLQIFGPFNPPRELQALGWFLFTLTLVAGAAFWIRAERSERLHWFGAFLFGLLPAYVYFAARVNNDLPLPLFGIAVLGGILAYWRKPSGILALGIGLAATAAMATKLNGLALWAGALICAAFPPGPRRLEVRKLLLLFAPGALFLAYWISRNLRETGVPFYTNFPFLDPRLLVPNDAYRFLSFDLRAYLAQDGAQPWYGPIRSSFPTYFVITALFGEFTLRPGLLLAVLAVRAAFLPIVICLGRLLGRGRELWGRPLFRASAILAGLQLALLLALVVRQPASCSMDARYLAPSLLPIAILASYAVKDALGARQKGMRAIARAGIVSFPAAVAVFYWLLLFA